MSAKMDLKKLAQLVKAKGNPNKGAALSEKKGIHIGKKPKRA